jgi:hypothetical protein
MAHEMTTRHLHHAPLERTVALVRRIGSGLRRHITEDPFTFDQLDASAEALWPANPEETDPPRWRLDLMEPRPLRATGGRADAARVAGEAQVRGPIPLRTARSAESCR